MSDMKQIKVGIIGGAGYTGGEAVRLLINHPNVELVYVHSNSNGGNRIKLIYRGDNYKEHAFIKNALVSSFEWTFDRDYDRPWTICLSRQPCNFDTRYRLVLRTNNPIELTPLS